MSAHLHPCESCARHLRVTSVVCPFCGAVLSDAFRATPERAMPGRRLARAAIFALATSTAAACGGAQTPEPQQTEPAPPPDNTAPAYGVAPDPQVVTPDVPVAAYGAAPAPAYGGPPSGGGNVQPMYGGPPKE